MCDACCRATKGWFKSFTRTEALLTVCEGVLLVVCAGFLIFLILHLVACPTKFQRDGGVVRNESYTESNDTYTYAYTTGHTTLDPDVECTWEPSHKTTAATRYYDDDVNTAANKPITRYLIKQTLLIPQIEPTGLKDIDDLAFEDQSDGETADDTYTGVVLALVKLNPPRETTFGCTLTAISDRWTVTAASCIEGVEEVDSLASFVMMEGYGGPRQGRAHAVSWVRVHPRYGGANFSYDIAALQSADRLRGAVVRLAGVMDYLLVTIGERLTLLGFGGFRSTSSGRGVREMAVYSVPAALCESARGGRSARHVSRGGRAARHVSRGGRAAALCVGVLYARGAPCHYCAGAPLMRARALLGLQARAQRPCGAACEPAPYVNIALVRGWLEQLLTL